MHRIFAKDNIPIAVFDLMKQFAKLRGMRLHIIVHKKDQIARYLTQTGNNRGMLTEISSKVNPSHVRIMCANFAYYIKRTISRPIINQNEFVMITKF